MSKLNETIAEIFEMQPNYLSNHSAWIEHIPFAWFCMKYFKPRILVELGVDYGDSLFAFDQANETADIYGIDYWRDKNVRDIVFDYRNQSRKEIVVLDSDFNDEVDGFAPNVIDLLHIDGNHSYEEVKNDFEKWLPKMSKQGIVLFHDTRVKGDGDAFQGGTFGVWKLWEELIKKYPQSFEFYHCYGLGVLFVGDKPTDDIKEFFYEFNLNQDVYREIFKNLGKKIRTYDTPRAL